MDDTSERCDVFHQIRASPDDDSLEETAPPKGHRAWDIGLPSATCELERTRTCPAIDASSDLKTASPEDAELVIDPRVHTAVSTIELVYSEDVRELAPADLATDANCSVSETGGSTGAPPTSGSISLGGDATARTPFATWSASEDPKDFIESRLVHSAGPSPVCSSVDEKKLTFIRSNWDNICASFKVHLSTRLIHTVTESTSERRSSHRAIRTAACASVTRLSSPPSASCRLLVRRMRCVSRLVLLGSLLGNIDKAASRAPCLGMGLPTN